MKISVVIPAHNEEKYIGRCLESLIGQDFGEFEIVVCLNACKDGTEGIVKKFSISNFQFPISIVKENRKGVVFARQTGTKAARGEIIASADADTRYPKNWLSKIAKTFQKNPKIVGAYGPVYLYDGSLFLKAMARIFYLPFLYLSKLFGHDNAAGMNFAFKKDFFHKIKGYHLNLKSAEDMDLARRLKKYGEMKIIPSLKVYSSARRFKIGFFKFFAHHARNYFRVFFLKKEPQNFRDVR